MLDYVRVERDRITQGVRLILAASSLLIFWINRSDTQPLFQLTTVSLAAYVAYSALFVLYSRRSGSYEHERLVHWADASFFLYIVALTGNTNSPYFFLFYFAVLAASFRWGFREGVLVTLTCAASFTVLGVVAALAAGRWDFHVGAIRLVSLLAIGYLTAYWGGQEIRLQEKLQLLQEVSNIWNPRFGMQHAIGINLDRLVRFYNAQACTLVLKQPLPDHPLVMYNAVRGKEGQGIVARDITAETAGELLSLPPSYGVLYNARRTLSRPLGDKVKAYESQQASRPMKAEGCDRLASLLDAEFFVTVPYQQRGGASGRIFLTADRPVFSLADLLFLDHVSGEISALSENVSLMEELIGRATEYERLNISRDIHDTTIQPYIGIKLAVEALSREVVDEQVSRRLGEIIEMIDNTVRGLRTYATNLRSKAAVPGDFLVSAIRKEAEHFRRFYGMEVEVQSHFSEQVSGRVAAEAFQIVVEGLSNVLKHSVAKRASIDIRGDRTRLQISIENEARDPHNVRYFTPRSITERTRDLNGTTQVETTAEGRTIVRVSIPTAAAAIPA